MIQLSGGILQFFRWVWNIHDISCSMIFHALRSQNNPTYSRAICLHISTVSSTVETKWSATAEDTSPRIATRECRNIEEETSDDAINWE
jgi:hypothetical protein